VSHLLIRPFILLAAKKTDSCGARLTSARASIVSVAEFEDVDPVRLDQTAERLGGELGQSRIGFSPVSSPAVVDSVAPCEGQLAGLIRLKEHGRTPPIPPACPADPSVSHYNELAVVANPAGLPGGSFGGSLKMPARNENSNDPAG